MVVLYVEQEESVRRQMMRAQLASLHNQYAFTRPALSLALLQAACWLVSTCVLNIKGIAGPEDLHRTCKHRAQWPHVCKALAAFALLSDLVKRWCTRWRTRPRWCTRPRWRTRPRWCTGAAAC